MKVLILGLNYAPEQVGIGPYTAGMAQALAAAGHSVTVVCGQPYYPAWRVNPAYRRWRALQGDEQGVTVMRLPLYVPRTPTGVRRILHHFSFALVALFALLVHAWRRRPDVLVAIAPSLLSAAAARVVAGLFRIRLWLHVHDFEVAAAVATGLLAGQGLPARMARRFERWCLRAHRVSSISPQMCDRLAACGVPPARVVEFRNWAGVEDVTPLHRPSLYRAEWAIDRPFVALYAGTIANKQGLEIIVATAARLRHRRDLAFVICGEGPLRDRLELAAAGLPNLQFRDLQPRDRLGELLGLATVHLLPQIAGAADLLLPSKLANMLASGRPVVTTAAPGTGLASEVDGCGIVVPPGDDEAFATAIEGLLDDRTQRETLGWRARRRAEERWSRPQILDRFERQLRDLVA